MSMFFSAPYPELFTLGVSMLYAGTSVEEAFRASILLLLYKISLSSTKSHPTSTTLQIVELFFFRAKS
jgi:hypothetical protein